MDSNSEEECKEPKQKHRRLSVVEEVEEPLQSFVPKNRVKPLQ
jgi:hypothetical protein